MSWATRLEIIWGASGVYDEIRTDSRIVFLSEPAEFSENWRMARKQITGGPNALTDAYLAVFAKSVDATVVTFDRRFKDIAGANIFVVPQV
jgi:predicted nucleic acid-binding protein